MEDPESYIVVTAVAHCVCCCYGGGVFFWANAAAAGSGSNVDSDFTAKFKNKAQLHINLLICTAVFIPRGHAVRVKHTGLGHQLLHEESTHGKVLVALTSPVKFKIVFILFYFTFFSF